MAISFDKASGVVYSETTSAPVVSMVSSWASHARGKTKKLFKNRGRGASKLQDMARRSCVQNLDLFTAGTLEDAGWHYAEKIYQECKEREALSFNDWNIFFEVFPSEIDPHHEFRLQQRGRPALDFFPMAKRLASLETNVVTILSLRNLDLKLEHFMSIIGISTLGILCLQQTDEYCRGEVFSLRDLRAWGRALRESSALQHLKVLMMYNFDFMDMDILNEVDGLPALDVAGLQGLPDFDTAPKLEVITQSSRSEWTCMDWYRLREYRKHGLGQRSQPNSIWSHPAWPTLMKLRILYDGTCRVNKTTSHSRKVCVFDGEPPGRPNYDTIWYKRTMKYHVADPAKRQLKDQDSGSNRQNKKRKVRDAKQVDVGALLGEFG